MSEKYSRRAALQGATAAAVLAAAGCGRGPPESLNHVRIATTSGGVNLTMSELLRQQEFLEEFDVDPEVISMADGSKIVGGIYSNSVDVSPMSGFSQVFPAIERGADLKIVNAASLTPMLALFSGRPDIQTLKDLEGKIVGIGALGSLIHQLTVTLLKKYSVDISTVRFVSIGSNVDVFKGVMVGTVDAGAGPSSFIEDADMYQVHVIANGDMSLELPDFTYQAGYTSSRIIEAKRDILVRVLAAYAKLFRFVAQPEAKHAFLSARSVVFPGATEHEHTSEWDFLQKARPFSQDLMLSPERLRYLQQINVDFQIQKAVLPYDRVVEMSLARDALKLLR